MWRMTLAVIASRYDDRARGRRLAPNALEDLVTGAVVSSVSFRSVKLPAGVKGRLFLYRMPGRYEPLESVWAEVARQGISCIACLAAMNEIEQKSVEYARAFRERLVPCEVRSFPIPDFGVPEDEPAFWRFADDLAALLKQGHAILIHCGAGIGRTGTTGMAVLMALGASHDAAFRAVKAAGSHAETPSQRALLAARHGR
jgi:protein-tyrosine phosphatase